MGRRGASTRGIAVAGSEFVVPVRRLARNGFEAWSEVIARDYEGLVAKDETSLYEAGPTRRWLKVKQQAGPTRRTAGRDGLALACSPPLHRRDASAVVIGHPRVASRHVIPP
jgi:ATP-dependent DNA ligase